MAEKDKLQRVYLFEGSDDGLKAQAIDEMVSRLLDPASRDFDYEIIDGSSTTSERIFSAAAIPPFSSKARVVLVRRANRMPQSEQLSLAALIPRLPQSACLILAIPAPEITDGKPKKGSGPVKELRDAVKSCGQIRKMDPGRKGDAGRLAAELVSKEGKRAQANALRILAERSGGDYAILTSEIRKLADYVGERNEITVDDVRSATAATLEESIFSLVDAIGERNAAQALALTREYMDSAARPDAAAAKLVPMIARQMRYLWQVRLMQDARVSLSTPSGEVPAAVKGQFPRDGNVLDLVRRHSWQTQKLTRQAQNFNQAALGRAFEMLAEADLALKGGDEKIDDVRAIVELLIVRLCKGQ